MPGNIRPGLNIRTVLLQYTQARTSGLLPGLYHGAFFCILLKSILQPKLSGPENQFHLYARLQGQGEPAQERKEFFLSTRPITLLPGHVSEPAITLGILDNRFIKAVSYTHLDVYKRQGLNKYLPPVKGCSQSDSLKVWIIQDNINGLQANGSCGTKDRYGFQLLAPPTCGMIPAAQRPIINIATRGPYIMPIAPNNRKPM